MPRTHRALPPLNEVDLDESGVKRAYNRSLFDVVAPAYGKVTEVLSLGRDKQWKKQLIGMLPDVGDTPICVDAACGPGDLIGLVRGRFPAARIVGIDLNREMLLAGQGGTEGGTAMVQGDMQRLPLPDGVADIVTGGYALRNAPDLDRTLRELARVLKPGGLAAFLDFSRPPSRTLSSMEHGLLRVWGGLWGRVFHGNPEVYGYIAESLAHFPDRDELTQRMSAAGLEPLETRRFFGGIIEIRLARKAP